MYGRKRCYSGPITRSNAKRFKTMARGRSSQWRPKTRDVPYIPKRGTTSSKFKAVQRALNRLAPEVKYADLTSTFTNVLANTGGVDLVNQIATGDNQSQRTADGIVLRQIDLTVEVVRTQSAIGGYQKAFLVQDLQSTGANPTCTEIFSSTDPLVARPSLDTLKRFRILKMSPLFDSNMCGSYTGISAATVTQQSNIWTCTWKGMIEARYDSTATTDFYKNPVFICVLSSGGDTADFDCSYRVAFTDA